ncbi:MAG: helix-turn-helix domain-containing protein, partial [Litoreibacter sp.]
RHEGRDIIVDRTITYEQIASIVGATRQWITQSFDRMQADCVLTVSRKEITIHDASKLEE